MSNSFVRVVFILAVLSVVAYAQSETDEAKEKAARRSAMIEALAGEIPQLRLPENRAVVSARIGSIIWAEDAERAGKFFREAVAELIAAQTFAEENKRSDNQFYDLLNSQSLRPQILGLIGAKDAEFALESFYRSRPTAIERAMAGRPADGKIGGQNANSINLTQNEVNLEQRLIRLVAEQRPERSASILRAAIEKKLSGETLSLLKKVFEKDPSAANELAEGVVGRLVRANFEVGNQFNYEYINLSNAILADFLASKDAVQGRLRFDEGSVRPLAEKIIDIYLTRGTQVGYIPLQQLEPICKVFSPASYEKLKTVAGSMRGRGGFSPISINDDYNKFMQSNPSADAMVTEAKKFPTETRRSIFQTAANKYSEAGQYDRALALVNDSFSGDALENAVSSLNWYYAHALINKGEYDAAEAVMYDFNNSNRISGLTSLAMAVYNKDPEANRSRAAAMLQRVRGFLPDKPETNNDLSQLTQLTSNMAVISPEDAFREFDAIIPDLNVIIDAFAVVNSFQGGNIRQGEFSLANGSNFGIYLDSSIFYNLYRNDLRRTIGLIDSFSRREVRISLKLQILESGI